ncbi:MAG: TatD family hydrolase [Clostridiales bacterium]|nr:TatD family hydrolase [Clostridiales bacterium]
MIFETHAHYDDARFDADREEVLARVHAAAVSPIINVGSSIESTKISLKIAGSHDYVYAAVGVHPDSVDELNEENFAWLTEQTKHPKAVAVGEIGLDYHHGKEEMELQKKWFIRQLDLARESGLPVIIHSRDAAEDTLTIMREQRAEEIPGVIHCFSYSLEIAREFEKMGYYFGIGGVVTFPNSKRLVSAVAQLPMERILLETDSPYLAPQQRRGERNDSGNIPFVIEKIAEIKGMKADEVERIAEENAYRLFAKIPHKEGA